MTDGRNLPVNLDKGGKTTTGYATPKADKRPQIMSVPPRRVVPIVFIPGIMGSNLRLSAARQKDLGKSDNMAWNPDDKTTCLALIHASPAIRQKQLDPGQTEVDTYDPVHNPTGDPAETADMRHSPAKPTREYYAFPPGALDTGSVLLLNDPPGTPNGKTREQKAYERGWGEVLFSSYKPVLELCESHLNMPFGAAGKPTEWWSANMLGVAPARWGAVPEMALPPLDENTLREAVKGRCFPVHAMGYNWLKSNRDSGMAVAKRIEALIARYASWGFQCDQVILVTHSMGGLVARAVIHPEMGNLKHRVAGIVHGVMPAIGAAAGYRRFRCGVEGIGPASKVCGPTGQDVTAVLANAQGGMELLPSEAYGNGWLLAGTHEATLMKLPAKGDPYEEIYKVRGKWYQLLNESWINPGGIDGSSLQETLKKLDAAKAFHRAINGVYHENSYAHYGADAKHPAWRDIVWRLSKRVNAKAVDTLRTLGDEGTGRLTLNEQAGGARNTEPLSPFDTIDPSARILTCTLLDATAPGDQTVPMHSADDQARSGKFKGIFRQAGYEHQASYADSNALFSTLYSIIRIAHSMTGSTS